MGNLALSFESHSSIAPVVKHYGTWAGGWFLDSGKILSSRGFVGLSCNQVVPVREVANDRSTHEVTKTNDYEDFQWELIIA